MQNKGKCPKDGRKNRPIYIIVNNKRTLAIADGEGHTYRINGKGTIYDIFTTTCNPENKYNPEDYDFERGLSGMDF